MGWRPQQSRGELADSLRDAIRDGRLAAGAALPSTRQLARDLGVARGTVTRVYAELAAEGYLRIRQGAATTVGSAHHLPSGTPVAAERPALRWDLHPCRPGISEFPRQAWLAAAGRVLEHADGQALGYAEERGPLNVRTAIARYVSRTRGVTADPERIVVCGGFSHAMSVLAAALYELGAREIAFEDPSSPTFRRIAHAEGLRPVGVPVDAEGIRASEVDSPAVVLTPASQYPTGVTLTPARRTALARWAEAADCFIVEDDYNGEFRFDKRQVGAFQPLAPERIVYAGTASKSLAPAVRVSWLVLPQALVGPVRAVLARRGWRPPALDQLIIAELLESGDYDRHVRRSRLTYRARRARLLATLPPRLIAPHQAAVGVHLLLTLPDNGPGEAEVMAAAERHSVTIAALGDHWVRPRTHPQGIMVGYGTPAESAFGPAVEALLKVLAPVL